MNTSFRIYLPAAVTLLLVGCTKGDAPRVDSTTAATSKAVGASPAALRAAGRSLPGALTKPLDSYTGDELYAFVHALTYTGDSVRSRNCRNDPSCVSSPQSKKVRVGVAAIVGQDSLSAGTTPKYGVIYARATNLGDAEEARYGMKPGKKLEYYLVVLPDSARGMQWRLEQLDAVGTRAHASIGTGPFKGCGHPWKAGARADFSTCAKSAARNAALPLTAQLQASDADPIWITCAEGCCEATSA